MLKALEILRRELQNNYEKRPFVIKTELYHKERIEDFHEAIEELEALEIKDTKSMTREEARKLIDKHSKKDEFGVGVVSKKMAYIIADYLPKAK